MVWLAGSARAAVVGRLHKGRGHTAAYRNRPPTALMDEQPVEALFTSPAYGMHISQWWHLDALARDMNMTRDMGFGWVKQTFPWRDIEGYRKGEYDWFRPDAIVDAAEEAGLGLIVRIDRQPLWSVESLPPEQITPHQPPVDYQDFGEFLRRPGSTLPGSHRRLPGVE